MTDRELLRRAAERAGQRRFYLASSLLAYARAERLDDAGLVDRLGCDPARLPALMLCRKPTGEAPVFRADVEAIAERFGLNPTRLAHLLRRADSLVALARAPASEPGGVLAAARDREMDGQEQDERPADHPLAGPEPAEGDA
jgi:hypothetical protein